MAARVSAANALLPGPIGTPMTAELFDTPEKLERRRVHMPLGRFGEAAERWPRSPASSAPTPRAM